MSILEKNLNKNYTLPSMNPIDLIKFSEISSTRNNTHINLIAHVPIAYNKQYKLSKIIPIPTIKDNKTYILNREPEIYIQHKNDTSIFPTHSLNKCKNSNEITICNAILQENIHKLDNCTIALISKSSDINCLFKEITPKNYIIHISNNDIYFHIHSPMALKLSCKDHSKKFNLTTSNHIKFNNLCTITKSINDTIPKSNSYIESDPKFQAPKFSTFDNISKDYIELIPLTQHELLMLQTVNNSEKTLYDIQKLKEKIQIKQHSQMLDSIANIATKTIPHKFKNMTSSIKNFFKNIYDTMIFVVISCTLIPLILALVIMITCRINAFKCLLDLLGKKKKQEIKSDKTKDSPQKQ